ncbi:undecaprenyl-phosphate glucose phosphotransferase [Zavarzinia sp. CC-PAN008]|uniref:undecaprenyl-phosphate glucose phosphotransferase n=1 Tax=Zavarzinia sp. CC-PAN008 TaxID=3243332 RepID=UPI003F7420D4
MESSARSNPAHVVPPPGLPPVPGQATGRGAAALPNISIRDSRRVSSTYVGGITILIEGVLIAGLGLACLAIAGTGADRVAIGLPFAAAILHFLLADRSGLYRTEVLFRKQPPLLGSLQAWVLTGLLVAVGQVWLGVIAPQHEAWLLPWALGTPAALISARYFLAGTLDGLARAGLFADRVVIVGAGDQGQRLAQHLHETKGGQVRLLGFVDDRASRIPNRPQGHAILGDVDALVAMIRANQVDEVVIALPWTAENRIAQLVARLSDTPVHVRLAPDLAGFGQEARQAVTVGGVTMLKLLDRPISGWQAFLKAAEDRVLAGFGLLLLSPLLLLIMALIKLDSRGPVFFKQKRYGFNCELIEVWKFRTMYADMADADARQQTTRDDPRVTPIGRILRKSSLDELPQLLNVLNGTMSIVGPRPHAVATKAAGRVFEEVVDSYAARHKVKPGITGWAQVNGWRGETDTVEKIQRRVEHDLFYIENWSLWFDIKVIALTVVALFKNENAY